MNILVIIWIYIRCKFFPKRNTATVEDGLMKIPFVFDGISYNYFVPYDENEIPRGDRKYIKNENKTVEITSHHALSYFENYPGYKFSIPITKKLYRFKRPIKE